jgi:hypothetical protein
LVVTEFDVYGIKGGGDVGEFTIPTLGEKDASQSKSSAD